MEGIERAKGGGWFQASSQMCLEASLFGGKEGDVIRVGGWAQNAFLLESFKRIPLGKWSSISVLLTQADVPRLRAIWCRLPGCGALSNATIKLGSLQHKVPFILTSVVLTLKCYHK